MQRRLFARRGAHFALAVMLGSVATMAAGEKPKDWKPDVDPASFASVVDNAYLPLQPGKKFRFQQKDGDETLTIEVLSQPKAIVEVEATVVRETHTKAGQVVEVADSWFAQDRDGNVWCFGKAIQEYQNGSSAGTEGSWAAGVNGARPGIIMKAQPQDGDTYFQGYAPGVAEDMASVVATDGNVKTPLRIFRNVLRTKEWTPLEANSVEHKSYAPRVGLIVEEKGSSRLELVAMN